jgi:hypothetical protein
MAKRRISAQQAKKEGLLEVGQVYDYVIQSGVNYGKVVPMIFSGYKFSGDIKNPESLCIFTDTKGRNSQMNFAEFIQLEFKS